MKITRVVELEISGGLEIILPEATPEACLPMAWMRPHFMDATGQLRASIQAFVIEVGNRRIIVDTCIGNDKNREILPMHMLHGPFLRDLAAAGFAPGDIDTVLCTHLHVDHVGWNTMLVEGKWVPTFPSARYLMGRSEFEYWRTQRLWEDQCNVFEDSVAPVFDAELVDLVDVDYVVCDEVRLISTPGHSPGHISVQIESDGQKALITGDFIHHPCQLSRPDWAASTDYDSSESTSTRRTMLSALADAPILVLGTHFASPSAGYVVRDGAVYRFRV